MSGSGAPSAPPPYVLLELSDVSPVLNQPLMTTSRIKYTCFDVSRSLIVLGATSGGIYVFSREPLEFLQLIPNKEGVVTRLAISSDEKYIAFANGRGLVVAVECSLQSGSQSSSRRHESREHQGNEVTAMLWSSSPMLLYVGDDVGTVSILQIPTFMTKTIFQSSTQIIMNLDARVCQLDLHRYMLVVSTLTRCYICDTTKEQYRQIGHKLRDGEYGVCFLTHADNHESAAPQKTRSQSVEEKQEVKKYNVLAVDDNFAVSENLANTVMFCARPSSRLWEAAVDGTVRRTHQYKQVLARPTSHIVTETSYLNENVNYCPSSVEREAQSLNFAKLYALKNCVLFTYKKDAIYFLNSDNVEHTMWYDKYKDIVDCKVFQNIVFLWRENGTMVLLLFLKIDKYLVKCFVEEKFILCGELCALYEDYLLSSNNLASKLHIVSGLQEKLRHSNNELLERINPVLDRLKSLRANDATQMKSGIYVVDNNHHTQSSFLDENSETNEEAKYLPPEALQTLKGLSLSVTDKFSSSKKKLLEKWEDLEEKMKNIGMEKHYPHDIGQAGQAIQPDDLHADKCRESQIVQDDLIYKESSQSNPTVELDISVDKNRLFKSLYKQYMLYLVNEAEGSNNLYHILDGISHDIRVVYQCLLKFEEYCTSVDLTEEEYKFISSSIFLIYINSSERKDCLLNEIINDTELYQVFVDSCIMVNLKTQKISNLACECGYPLPYSSTSQSPSFADLIDTFIEMQWSSRTQSQCYEICKRMPYLWRKILYLRRNEDLLNILLLLLQMLDETLLYSFLPQFTTNTWDRTIQLYSILCTNVCLNCRKHFENVNVKEMLSWDSLGALLIKSVGGKDAVSLMKRHADLIETGELTLKFYHTCLLVARYEKYDGLIRNQLTDALYCAYQFDDARNEICHLLRNSLKSDIRNTSLPLIVAAKSSHWGLPLPPATAIPALDSHLQSPESATVIANMTSADLSLHSVLEHFKDVNKADCVLCGLPLVNEVLIRDGGLWVFRCGHTFHGACLDLLKVKLCTSCTPRAREILLAAPKEVIL